MKKKYDGRGQRKKYVWRGFNQIICLKMGDVQKISDILEILICTPPSDNKCQVPKERNWNM